MVQITFIQPDGTSQTVTAEEGLTVMWRRLRLRNLPRLCGSGLA